VVFALGLALAPLPAAWVERVYANGLHPPIQHLTTRLTNLVPVTLGDLVIAAAILRCRRLGDEPCAVRVGRDRPVSCGAWDASSSGPWSSSRACT
jgi:hypothetical protein